MNFHQMSSQLSHMSSKLPDRQQNPIVAQVSGWGLSIPSQYDAAKSSYNQFSKQFPMQNSSVMQQHIQLDAEKRRQLFKIRQDQAQQHAQGISDAQLRSTQFTSLSSHLQQQPPPPYTTYSPVFCIHCFSK